jgi:hypothetical protein
MAMLATVVAVKCGLGAPVTPASVFSLGIEQAVFVDWDTEHGLMTIHRWSPQSGYAESSRHYP